MILIKYEFFVQLSRYSSMEGVLYCKPHYEQLFKESGSFTKNFQSRMYCPLLLPAAFHLISLLVVDILLIWSYYFSFRTAVKPAAEKSSPELVNVSLSGFDCKLFRYIEVFSYIVFFFFVCSQTRTPSRVAGMFSGTQEKCATCSKTVYPIEKVNISSLPSCLFH